MIDTTHWGLPQYLLILFLFLQAGMDMQVLPARFAESLAPAHRHPSIIRPVSLIASLIEPVAILCLTCWGGFFA